MDRIWIVVCDASRCRFFMKHQGSQEWVKFEQFDHPAGRSKGIDLVSDRPGRTLQNPSPSMRAGTEPRTDPHEVEVERFAGYISDTLDRALGQNAFDKLVLVAPPHFLGHLRSALSDRVQKAIYATLDKDYTRADESELQERVELP